eukprot:g6289.t1
MAGFRDRRPPGGVTGSPARGPLPQDRSVNVAALFGLQPPAAKNVGNPRDKTFVSERSGGSAGMELGNTMMGQPRNAPSVPRALLERYKQQDPLDPRVKASAMGYLDRKWDAKAAEDARAAFDAAELARAQAGSNMARDATDYARRQQDGGLQLSGRGVSPGGRGRISPRNANAQVNVSALFNANNQHQVTVLPPGGRGNPNALGMQQQRGPPRPVLSPHQHHQRAVESERKRLAKTSPTGVRKHAPGSGIDGADAGIARNSLAESAPTRVSDEAPAAPAQIQRVSEAAAAPPVPPPAARVSEAAPIPVSGGAGGAAGLASGGAAVPGSAAAAVPGSAAAAIPGSANATASAPASASGSAAASETASATENSGEGDEGEAPMMFYPAALHESELELDPSAPQLAPQPQSQALPEPAAHKRLKNKSQQIADENAAAAAAERKAVDLGRVTLNMSIEQPHVSTSSKQFFAEDYTAIEGKSSLLLRTKRLREKQEAERRKATAGIKEVSAEAVSLPSVPKLEVGGSAVASGSSGSSDGPGAPGVLAGGNCDVKNARSPTLPGPSKLLERAQKHMHRKAAAAAASQKDALEK